MPLSLPVGHAGSRVGQPRESPCATWDFTPRGGHGRTAASPAAYGLLGRLSTNYLTEPLASPACQ